MPAVRMQSRYWKMLRRGIKLAIEEQQKLYESKKREVQKRTEQEIDTADLCRELSEIRDNIKRYEAIDELVMNASYKKDCFFSNGIGPDMPNFDTPVQDDEEKLRRIEQVD